MKSAHNAKAYRNNTETAKMVTDSTMTKVRVDNMMDLATPRPMNIIHGAKPFRVAGFNMVTDDEGAEIYLQNVSAGFTAEARISEGMRDAHISALRTCSEIQHRSHPVSGLPVPFRSGRTRQKRAQVVIVKKQTPYVHGDERVVVPVHLMHEAAVVFKVRHIFRIA